MLDEMYKDNISQFPFPPLSFFLPSFPIEEE